MWPSVTTYTWQVFQHPNASHNIDKKISPDEKVHGLQKKSIYGIWFSVLFECNEIENEFTICNDMLWLWDPNIHISYKYIYSFWQIKSKASANLQPNLEKWSNQLIVLSRLDTVCPSLVNFGLLKALR